MNKNNHITKSPLENVAVHFHLAKKILKISEKQNLLRA
jgi:hypothetical protein